LHVEFGENAFGIIAVERCVVWYNVHAEEALYRTHFANSEGGAKLFGQSIDLGRAFAKDKNIIDVNSDNNSVREVSNLDVVLENPQ
jgi:hypothetical protein